MKNRKKFSEQLADGDFLVTAEYLPKAEAEGSAVRSALQLLQKVPSAVNVSDNPIGVAVSSLAASVLLSQSGIEPIYQVVMRDRNRIAIQSDLLGAASLGIGNVLCLSGYHQTLTSSPESANVYDIDSTQCVAMVKKMNESGELLDGTRISGAFSAVIGAAANPYLKPLELNMIRLGQKVESGANFIQTQAVFDPDEFQRWFDSVRAAGLMEKTAVLAGVLPLESAAEAERLREHYTEFNIPDVVIERLKSAGDAQAQRREGLAICAEIVRSIREMKGLRGIHIFSGGREERLPEILAASGLAGD
jgi:methylenetetrahydrofolate reductase (NADPH)